MKGNANRSWSRGPEAASSALVLATAALSGLARGRLGDNRGDHGATAAEYALMAGLIALVIISSVYVFGQNVITLFAVPTSVFNP